MFQLHDQIRRRICITAFFLLGVVPTAGVSTWCLARHLPGHVRAEARSLSRELGLEVSLDGLRHLRPGIVLYEGLQLADPETGRSVLRCRLLEIGRKEIAEEQGNRKVPRVLIASGPEIEADGVDQLGRLLGRLLQRQSGRPELDLWLTAGEVTLRAAENSRKLTELQGSIESSPGGTQAQLSFRLAETEMPQPVRIRIVRNRQTTPPTTGFELATDGSVVPCEVLALGLPILKQLGPRSQFRGHVWANQMPDGWHGEVTGQLLGVDLGKLVTDRFPHTLGGTAEVTVYAARFRRERLEEASGTLLLGPGVISRCLMDAAVEHLGLVRGAEPRAPGELVPYEQLALAFLVDSRGLQLQGRCSRGGGGAILVDRYSRLLGEPRSQPKPVVALLRTLVPASEVQVPATRQTDWLIRRLPIPQLVPPHGA